MYRLLCLLPFVLIALIAGCSGSVDDADYAAQHEITGKLPPLIDRELFFGDPEISGSNLSPDGRFVSFIKPYVARRPLRVLHQAL